MSIGVGVVEEIDRPVLETLIDRQHHQRAVCRSVLVHQAVQTRALADRKVHLVEGRARESAECVQCVMAARFAASERLSWRRLPKGRRW